MASTNISRQGISELYVPPPGTATTALIVFVHGLFGHPYKTWTWEPRGRSKSPSSDVRQDGASASELRSGIHATNTHLSEPGQPGGGNSPVYWPRDLLPDKIPDARIYTWGYDADIDALSSASRNTIHQHAVTLLSDLVDLRKESEYNRKPIIFVVHSLGGIVVKAALNLSRSTEGTQVKEIAPITAGVCFLGTPHRGSNTATIGKIAFQITKAAGKSPNTKILQGLERNSETLDMIGDDFIQTMLKYGSNMKVYSFREEKRTKKWPLRSIMIVDADSAKLGHGNEETSSIASNHRDMTKFYGPEDAGFKRVGAKLRFRVEEIRPFDVQTDTDCIDSLITDITKYRFREVEKAHAKTLHWLFDPKVTSFTTWLREKDLDSTPIYWIRGKPGSGKSTLMKFAIQDARTWEFLADAEGPKWTRVSFFFHDRGSNMQKSLVGMLQEVVGSLLSQLPQLSPFVEPEFSKLTKAQRTKHPVWDVGALRSALFAIVEQRRYLIRIALFLDALDEHQGDNEELVKLLKLTTEKADNDYVSLKICLASRSWNVFEHHFNKYWGLIIHEHTQSDIEVYTRNQLQSNTDGFPELLTPQNLILLVERITVKALGVFIWVRLVVDQLGKDIQDGTSSHLLMNRVDQMPQELNDLYTAILRRLEGRYVDEMYFMLHIAMSSLEPLPLQVFLKSTDAAMMPQWKQTSTFSVTSFSEMNSEPSYIEASEASNLRRLASRSGGLLETVETTTDDPDIRALVEVTEGRLSTSHSANSSNPETVERTTITIRTVQFLHATAKEYVQQKRHSLLKDRVQFDEHLNGYEILCRCCVFTGLWVSPIKKHMFSYIKMAELEAPETDQGDDRIRNMELVLSKTLEFDMPSPEVQALGSPQRLNSCTLRWLASQQKGLFCRMLEELLKFDTSIRDPIYNSLILAVACNAKKLLQYLLSLVNISDISGQNSKIRPFCLLQLAAAGPNLVPIEQQDRVGMIEVLVNAGYPVNQKAKLCTGLLDSVYKNWTPLGVVLASHMEWECSEGVRLDIIGCLLKLGADCNSNIRYRNLKIRPLNLCVRKESVGLVRILLQHGADPKEADHDVLSMQPMHYALIRNDKAITQALIDHECEGLRPKILPEADTVGSLAAKQALLMGSVGHPMVAAFCARGPDHLSKILIFEPNSHVSEPSQLEGRGEQEGEICPKDQEQYLSLNR